jgi:hypothetical protein
LRKVLRYVGADVVEAACRRIPVTRQDVAEDGLIANSDARATIQMTVTALAAHVRRQRDAPERG